MTTPAAGRSAPFLIHAEGGEEAEFEEFCSGIEEQREALAGGEALLGVLGFDGFCAAALADFSLLLVNTADEGHHAHGVVAGAVGVGVEFGCEGVVQLLVWFWAAHSKLVSIAFSR